ncbi:MAG: protein-L-isoaspartate(D-aspartate) O-methyltransferase [Candidatus Diapherotrites archaeon]|nr:protein-L-isoaspartate(D-aspartate) O-methyltransferase [Candidatus Diapherotrites archaeon]
MNKKKAIDNFALQRKRLVEQLKAKGIIRSAEIEKAFLSVRRELFFPENIREYAYIDSAFPLIKGATISQPTTIAIMLEMLDPKPKQKILEIGAGSGYVLALLSKIVGKNGKVFGVEIIPELVDIAKENLKKEKITNVEVVYGNGREGLAEKAPFDRILISAACSDVPKRLFEQLKENGKLVAPVGIGTQALELWQKKDGKINLTERRYGFVFVPLK